MAAQIRGQRFRDYRLPDRHSGAEAEGKARGREPGNLFFHKLLIAFYRRRSPQQNFTGREREEASFRRAGTALCGTAFPDSVYAA